MNPEYFWWGPMWVFPMIMPVIMLVALVLCLYFMFGRGGGGTLCSIRKHDKAQVGKWNRLWTYSSGGMPRVRSPKTNMSR